VHQHAPAMDEVESSVRKRQLEQIAPSQLDAIFHAGALDGLRALGERRVRKVQRGYPSSTSGEADRVKAVAAPGIEQCLPGLGREGFDDALENAVVQPVEVGVEVQGLPLLVNLGIP